MTNKQMHRIVILLLFLGIAHLAWAQQDGDPASGFSVGSGANSKVYASAVQSDGKVLFGGDFTLFNTVTANRIVRLNTDGSVDLTFNSGTGANSTIYDILVEADDKIMIVGNFTSYNGTPINRVARLNADGSIDSSFDPGTGADNIVKTVTKQSDGKYLIGGHFLMYNGFTKSRICRLTATGGIDGSFSTGAGVSGGADPHINRFIILSDASIVAVGLFTSYNGNTVGNIFKVNGDGAHDTGFTSAITVGGANAEIFDIDIQSDGKLVLGGDFSLVAGLTRKRIARINATGTLDGTFDPGTGASAVVRRVLCQPNNKVLIAGEFINVGGPSRFRLAKLNSNGTLLSVGFTGPCADNAIYTVTQLANGHFYVGGDFLNYGGSSSSRVAKAIIFNNAPQFSSSEYAYNLDENSSISTYVGLVSATDANQDGFTYSILSGNTLGAFSLDPSTGNITVAYTPAIDHETFTSFSLVIEATDDSFGPAISSCTVTITLNNLNDNPVSLGVDESHSPTEGFMGLITDINHTDLDGMPVTYSIVSGDPLGHFSIGSEGALNSTIVLDYELVAVYNLEVFVTDGVFSDNMFVTVNVGNVNDNPVSLGPDDVTSISENVFGPVATIPHTDLDGLPVSYTIISGDIYGLFIINSIGELTMISPGADYELATFFSLQIQVSDGIWSDEMMLTVNIGNLNDSPISTGVDESHDITENTAGPIFITSIPATDADMLPPYNFNIISGDVLGQFFVDAGGSLSMTDPLGLDFENISTYTLEVQVDDGLFTDVMIVTVNVLNIDDNDPTLMPSDTLIYLAEASAAGTFVANMYVTDPDPAPAYSYSLLSGNTDGAFALNASTGEITVANALALDFDVNPTFVLEIACQDAAFKGDTVYMTINLIDGSLVVDPVDVAALEALYTAVGGGADWTFPPVTPVHEWDGVTVADNHVTEIILPYRGLTGSFPIDLVGLDFLRKLDYSGNNLTGSLPTWLGNLDSLRHLDLDDNDFYGSVPSEITNLTQLRTLILSRNEFTSLPSSLTGMNMLAHLFVQDNQLSALPSNLSSLSNLRSLNASANLISSIDGVFSASLPLFKYLNLSNNQLSTLPDVFDQFPILEYLNISTNSIESIPATLYASLPDSNLYVYSNLFDFADLEPIIFGLPAGYDYVYAPQKRMQPNVDIVVLLGEPLNLSVSPGGASPTFQWYQNGAALPGGIASSLDFASVLSTQTGEYECVMTCSTLPGLTLLSPFMNVLVDCGSTVSLTVNTNFNTEFCEGDPVNAVLYAQSPIAGLSYQWYKNGAEVFAATDSVFTAQSSGEYTVVAIQSGGCSAMAGPIVINAFPGASVWLNEVAPNWISASTSVSGGYYQWYLDGVLLPDETDSLVYAFLPGFYTLEYTEPLNLCRSSSSPYYIGVTALQEADLLEYVTLFPNPSNSQCQLLFKASEKASGEVLVHDTNGRLLYKKQIEAQAGVEQSYSLDVSAWPTGLYVLTLKLGNALLNKKLSVY